MAHYHKAYSSVSGSAALDYSNPRVYPDLNSHVASGHIEHLYRWRGFQRKSIRKYGACFHVQRMGGNAWHVVGLSLDLLSLDRFYSDCIDYAADFSGKRNVGQSGRSAGDGTAGAGGAGEQGRRRFADASYVFSIIKDSEGIGKGDIFMKKLVAVILAVIILGGCNPFDSSDYQGFIIAVDEQSFMVCPCEGDPEAQYPIYEIFVDEETEIEGEKSDFAEIEEQDKVRVWVKEGEEAAVIAEKISVDSDGD